MIYHLGLWCNTMSMLREWYYADNTEPVGPVTADFLQQLVQNGILGADSLVWRQGNKAWQRFAEAFPALGKPLPAHMGVDTPQQMPAAIRALGGCHANIGRRIAARALDTLFVLIVLSGVLAIFMPQFLQTQMQDTLQQPNMLLIMAQNIAIYGLIALVNGLMTALTGASLGKRLFRLKVLNAYGKPLGLKQGLLREGHILLRLLVLTVPMNPMFSMILIGIMLSLTVRSLAQPRPVWDVACNAYTITQPLSRTEWGSRLAIALLLPTLIATAGMLELTQLQDAAATKNTTTLQAPEATALQQNRLNVGAYLNAVP